MELKDVFENYVTIITAILGVAYPIILDKTSDIGDRYKSEYLTQIFDTEFFQRKIKPLRYITYFEIVLYIALLSLIPPIFSCPPLFDWNNWFINNSAHILVFCTTVCLIVSFIFWLKEVILYNGKTKKLLKHISQKYEKSNNEEDKQILLKAINEITIYAIDKQDKRLEKDLLNFYVKTRDLHREKYSNLIESENIEDRGLEYPFDYYNTISEIVKECVETNNLKLLSIQHKAINGHLLIPNDFQQIKISDTTYGWLWYNVTLIRHNYNFVAEFWKNSSQYFRFELEQIYPNFQQNENGEIIDANKNISEQREEERNRFLEFHYAFGGLMLYSKNYEALNYMFTFSQSQPPKYELLPYTMTDFFKWFEWFSNEYNHLGIFIGYAKYQFPDLDNLGNRKDVVFQICKYICILFLRQFSIPETLHYHNPTKQPNLPQELKKLYNWQKSLEYFRFCLNKVLEDKEILQRLNLQQMFIEKESEINIFLEELEESIRTIIQNEKKNAEISKSKELQFYKSSSKILGDGFKQYENIRNKEGFDNTDKDVKTFIRGSQTLSPKSSFTDGDTPCVDCDSVFAHGIVQWNLKKYIPNAFLMARTQSYLLSKDDLIKGINKIVDKKENVCIIAFNLGNEIIQSIKQSKYKDKVIYLPSTDLRNLIFILKEKDLPKFTFKNVSGKEKQKFHLKGINKKYKIYASIIDINLPKNEKLKNIYANNLDKDNLQVLETLSFITEIRFRADRKIIQIKVNSVYEESGSVNSLDDLKPL
ncbi:hypothetical protein ACILDS_09935 [Capnocytophaga canis]|uniref:hypothetical protein n=1 Tax=Capnocytophaga canis TaxID=1848903 RepID=UPI0037D2411F